MTPILPPTTTQTVAHDLMMDRAVQASLCAKARIGMTGIQELHDDILDLESKLHGKRLELAMAQGDRVMAEQHRRDMYLAIQKHREFRINVGTEGDGCYFTAAGAVDADRVQRGAAA